MLWIPLGWLRRRCAPRFAAHRSRPPRTLPELEPLETRWVPASFSLSASSYSVGEGDGTVKITVVLDQAPGKDDKWSLNYATSDGTALNGKDYTTASDSLTFTSGQTSQNFSVSISDDALDEDNETFTVTLSSPSGGPSIGSPSAATVTITDNDSPPSVSFRDKSYTVTESEGAAKGATITVALGAASGNTVTVQYATSDGSATAGPDYKAASGTLTFNAGDTEKSFTVWTTDDEAVESSETVNLTLSSPSNATLGTSSNTLTITDSTPTIWPTKDNTGNGGSDKTSGPIGGNVQVDMVVSGGSKFSVDFECTGNPGFG